MKNNVNERLRLFIRQFCKTQTLFCEKSGIGNQSLSNMFSRNTNPSMDMISKIKYAYPELSIEWLLFGDGEMILKKEAHAGCLSDITKPFTEMIDKISELSGKLAVAENKIGELEKKLQEKENLADRSVTKETFPGFGK
jgi:transcriptional regulator with XRE-family HTH domain